MLDFDDEDFDESHFRVISTETILRASAVSQEDVDEQVKAKYISRLVKEYRKNRERAKQEQLKEQMEKEIELNIQKRFPSLTQSPDPNARATSGGRANGSRV